MAHYHKMCNTIAREVNFEAVVACMVYTMQYGTQTLNPGQPLGHLWLSRVKMHFRNGFSCFELGPRLHPEGDDKLATGNLKLETCSLRHFCSSE